MKWGFLTLFLFLLIVPSVSAKQGHLKLLAVKEMDDGYEGSIADLYLEIKSGTGRVFLDTFPLTKVDTQISTRFAKDMACSYLDRDCLEYDFIYTIKANSPIITGPSAGGAITLLTISLLEGFELDEGITITGTINSGGIIGPVGGIKEKIDAASNDGLRKVLIPEGERFIDKDIKIIEKLTVIGINGSVFENASIKNKTIDLVEYGRKEGIDVVEVSDINDVLYEFTGRRAGNLDYPLIIDDEYNDTMSSLASKLCNRSSKLLGMLAGHDYSEYNETMDSVLNLTSKAEAAVNGNRPYSAASYCFGANVKLTYLLLALENASEEEIGEKIEIIGRNVDKLLKGIDKKDKETVTDLEAYAIVKERLIEAEDFKKEVSKNITQKNIYSLAYSFERVYSAFSWANFFDHRGKKYDFNKELLESSCQKKIEEAEERYRYVLLFYPILSLEGTRKEIDYAYDDMGNGNYELCLFKATKAKAESDVILSVSGIGDDKVDGLLDKKLEAARKSIAKQINKGSFPVLAYSYYEYANELKESDTYSALLYSEYALELSDLSIYFKQVKNPFVFGFDIKLFVFLVIGAVIGYLFFSFLGKKMKAKRKKKR